MITDYKARFQKAIELKRQGDYEQALVVFDELISEKRDPRVFGVAGGMLLHEMNEPKRALPYLRDCTLLSPKSELASVDLFHTLIALGNVDEAFGEMKRLLSLRESEEYRQLLFEINSSDSA